MNHSITHAADKILSEMAGKMNMLIHRSHLSELELLTGISAKRLKAIAEGAEVEISELLPLCAASQFIARLSPSAAECGEVAGELTDNWAQQTLECEQYLQDETFREVLAETKTANTLDFTQKYRIYMDDSASRDDNMTRFLDRYLSLSKENSLPGVVIPSVALENLRESDPDALRKLYLLHKAKLLSLCGESHSSVRSSLISAMSRSKTGERMLLITQDRSLAMAISLLNLAFEEEGEDILIVYVGRGGKLGLWFPPKSDGCLITEEEFRRESVDEELSFPGHLHIFFSENHRVIPSDDEIYFNLSSTSDPVFPAAPRPSAQVVFEEDITDESEDEELEAEEEDFMEDEEFLDEDEEAQEDD